MVYLHEDRGKFINDKLDTCLNEKIIVRNSTLKNTKSYIKQFDNCKEVPVHFVGSIAFYLKDELQIMFDKYEMKLGNVLRRPIDGLIAYHISNK